MPAERIGLYLRLSRDDERGGESMSIENQRTYLQQYLADRNWVSTDCYVDDGYTGTNFDRPEFQRLLSDIDAGRITMVITKDLSRLGRDQIGTAYYYQIHFPKHQVRYIAVAEGLDTSESGSTSALFPFLTAANDFYTADISRKVRSALTTRKKEGKFIGSSAPLGYRKDPSQKGHLLVDEETASIVAELFHQYLTLGSIAGVAKSLTERAVPTPSQCKTTGISQKRFPGAWSDNMVRRILTNPTYAGHLTQNRSEKINYKLERCLSIPKERWIVIPNTHEPIVTQEDFDRVQELLATRSYTPKKYAEGHLLTGLAYCADCGSPMTYVRESPTRIYMVCQGYRKGGRLKLCTSHCVREDAVIEGVKSSLRELAQALDNAALADSLEQDQTARPTPDRQLKTAQQKLERLHTMFHQMYQDRSDGILDEAEFASLMAQNRADRTKWEEILRQTQQAITDAKVQQDAGDQVRNLLSFETLDRATVTALVERVVIHEDKQMELLFRFQKPD